MRIGILIIGSLYWEQTEHRRNWRDNRLDVAAECHVRVPIRYGRRSRTRGCSFTMVFSPGLSEETYGHAIVAPCKSEDLVGEAEWLWAAERNKARPGDRISADWGCVALLENPERRMPRDLRDEWIERVSREPCYGQMFNTPVGEEAPASRSGTLTIPWPATLSGAPLEFDVLIGTATNPTIVCGHYADVQQVADAWNAPAGREHVDYFHYNRESGISTFQDAEIEHLLANGLEE